MKEFKIIQVPVAEVDRLSQICFELRQEKYYLAYETDVKTPASVLFKDLDWFKKHFGVDHPKKGRIFTVDSLNGGRMNTISDLQRCIKANVPMWELGKVNKDGKIKISPDTGLPYQHYNLSETGKKQFQQGIDKGLFVLCELV